MADKEVDPKTGYLVFKDSKKFIHRWAAEKKYGKEAIKGMHIHHVNGNKKDNSKDNLILVTSQDHYCLTKFEESWKIHINVALLILVVIMIASWLTITTFLALVAFGILLNIRYPVFKFLFKNLF